MDLHAGMKITVSTTYKAGPAVLMTVPASAPDNSFQPVISRQCRDSNDGYHCLATKGHYGDHMPYYGAGHGHAPPWPNTGMPVVAPAATPGVTDRVEPYRYGGRKLYAFRLAGGFDDDYCTDLDGDTCICNMCAADPGYVRECRGYSTENLDDSGLWPVENNRDLCWECVICSATDDRR